MPMKLGMEQGTERERLVERIPFPDLIAATRRIYDTEDRSRLAARLRSLGPEWSRHRDVVLEDTPFDSTVDAIVVGPGGVFAIVLAIWCTDVAADDELAFPEATAAAVTSSPVSEACHAAWDTKTYLDWEQDLIHPVVAISGDFEPTRIGWATVVGVDHLTTWLQSRPEVVSWDQVLLASAILG